tara:strand:- start:478 stop:1347 length:870 start_codon:yes stop_codon:yes gene_type:complete
MDSMGIHQTELTNSNAAHHVADINSVITQHNAQTLDGFKQRMGQTRSSDRLTDDENVGEAVKDVLGAGLALKGANDMRLKFGGMSAALTQGTSENVYNLSGGRVGQGLIKARTMGDGVTAAGFRSAKQASTMAAPVIEDSSLDIVGKTFKKGLTTIGTDVATASRVASVAGAGLAGAGAIYTGVEDFGSANKWKNEGTLTRAGDVTSIVSGGLDVLSAVAPIFAPVAALAGVAGAIMDAVGERRDEAAGLNKPAPTAQATAVATSDAGQVASQGQASSIQTLSNKSSSY